MASSPLTPNGLVENANESEELLTKMKKLLRAKDPISIEELNATCEKLVTTYPRKASKNDAIFPIWRIHYDKINIAEKDLQDAVKDYLAGNSSPSGRVSELRPEEVRSQLQAVVDHFNEEIRLAMTHFDKIKVQLERFGNTDHGHRLLYKYFIYRGDCERYRDRNSIEVDRINSFLLSTSSEKEDHCRDEWEEDEAVELRARTTGGRREDEERYHHSVWAPRKVMYHASRKSYHSALALLPHFGQAYNQLGILHEARGERYFAAYFYMRALTASEKPFEKAGGNLSLIAQRALDTDPCDDDESNFDHLDKFSLAFLRLLHYSVLSEGQSLLRSRSHEPTVLIDRITNEFTAHLRSGLSPPDDHFGIRYAIFLIFMLERSKKPSLSTPENASCQELLFSTLRELSEIVCREELRRQQSTGPSVTQLRTSHGAAEVVQRGSASFDAQIELELLQCLLLLMEYVASSKSSHHQLHLAPGFAEGWIVAAEERGDWGRGRGYRDGRRRGPSRSHATDAADETVLPEDAHMDGCELFEDVFERKHVDGSAAGVMRRALPSSRLPSDEEMIVRKKRIAELCEGFPTVFLIDSAAEEENVPSASFFDEVSSRRTAAIPGSNEREAYHRRVHDEDEDDEEVVLNFGTSH